VSLYSKFLRENKQIFLILKAERRQNSCLKEAITWRKLVFSHSCSRRFASSGTLLYVLPVDTLLCTRISENFMVFYWRCILYIDTKYF